MTQLIWNYIKDNKWTNLLNLNLLLILLFPFYYTFGNAFESENLQWTPVYLIASSDIIFYVPLLILTIGFQTAKNKNTKILLIKLNLVFSFIYVLGTLLILYVAFQDFYYGLGLLLILTLFPLTFGILIIELKKQKNII